MNLILWIIIGCLAGVSIYFYKKSKKVVQLNTDTINKNKEISNLNVTLRSEISKLEDNLFVISKDKVKAIIISKEGNKENIKEDAGKSLPHTDLKHIKVITTELSKMFFKALISISQFLEPIVQ